MKIQSKSIQPFWRKPGKKGETEILKIAFNYGKSIVYTIIFMYLVRRWYLEITNR